MNEKIKENKSIIPESKIFAVWKPKGISSNRFIQELKKKLGVKKIGHGGTLDPLAEGVLVVGVDEGTKKLKDIFGGEKEYVATIKLGEISLTGDLEGPIKKVEVKKKPKKDTIDKILNMFSNLTEQKPPAFSAIKVKGVEAYKLARKGIIPELNSRKVKIHKLELLSYRWPFLKLRLVVSGGFYVRSLAEDIGKALGTGAFLFSLTRTRVGSYGKDKCLDTNNL